LEQHVVHGEIVRYWTAVIRGPRLGMRVSRKRDAIRFIDGSNDSCATVQAGFNLRVDGRR
jgi:hypothetical protein